MENLATELLHELKCSAKRWFIAFCVMVGLEVATIIGFLWYISLPIEETTTTTQTFESDDASNIQMIGGDNYGESETDKNNNK